MASDPNGSSNVTFVAGGRTFRLGFHRAFWGGVGIDDEEEAQRIARRENVLRFVSDLYHYTSLGGLQGIIDSSGFWASDNRFMNDSQEMRNGAELAARVLQHRMRRCRNPHFCNVLAEVVGKVLSPPKTGNLVACFSMARDSLEQWRGYGGSGAVCIGLAGNQPGARPLFYGSYQLPHVAFYDTRPKIVLLLSIIRRFEREYELDRQAMPDNWPDDHDCEYISHLSLIISGRIVAFKDSSYRQEQEVRLVIPFSQVDNYEGGLKFRVSPFGLIPYICTGDKKGLSGPLPISEVIIGPSPRQELIAESVRTFLDHNGYSGTEVNMSRVPFRSY